MRNSYIRTFVCWAVALSAVLIFQSAIETRAEPLDTYHGGFHLVRDTAAEDGATFAAAIQAVRGILLISMAPIMPSSASRRAGIESRWVTKAAPGPM